MKRILLILLLMSAEARAADWPQFLGPNRDSRSPETGLIRSFPEGGPKLLWGKDIGEGYAGPVVRKGKLILFHRIGDEDVIECLDAGKGTRQWKFAYPTDYRDQLGKGDGPRSTPLMTDDHVYTLSADGRLHCLTLDKGEKVWARDLRKDYQVPDSFFGIATSPILEAGNIVINIGGRKAGIVALDAKTGKEKWTATDHEASYASPVAAEVDGKRHLFFLTRYGLVDLDPKSGKVLGIEKWRARINASVNATSPVVVGDDVFVTSSYATGALLAEVSDKGLKPVWSNDTSLSSHYSPCVYDEGHLYGFDGRQEEGARLRCIEWKTGKVKWSKESFGCGSLILADGKLIVLDEVGKLFLLEATPRGYRELASASVLQGRCRAHIALADGRLYAHDGRKLICLDLGGQSK